MNPRFRILPGLLSLLSFVGGLGWLWWGAIHQSEINFLSRRPPAEWIVYPTEPDLIIRPCWEMSTVFKRSFVLDKVVAQATVRITGLRHYTVAVNGTLLAVPLRLGRNSL